MKLFFMRFRFKLSAWVLNLGVELIPDEGCKTIVKAHLVMAAHRIAEVVEEKPDD